MKPSWGNEGKPPLLVTRGGRRGPGRNADALTPLCRGAGRGMLTEVRSQVGALMLRGSGPLEPSEFARFVRDFSGKPPLDNVGGASPRVKVCEGVYTSTECPRHYTLSLHNELSYTYRWPERLHFYCETPAALRRVRMPFAGARGILLAMT